MNGTKAQVPRCLYCGAIGPWWECRCAWTEGVREGKRQAPKVRIVGGRTIIEVDAETARRNVLGFARPSTVDAPKPRLVDAPPSTRGPSVDAIKSEVSTRTVPVDDKDDPERLRRLKRERQARWRARE